MGASLKLITNQDLVAATKRDPPTQRGLPRVLQPAPAELRAGVNERSRYADHAPRATLAFATSEATIEYDAGAIARPPPPPSRLVQRRTSPIGGRPYAVSFAAPPPVVPDLDLGRARNSDSLGASTLIALSDLETRRWPTWLALGVGVAAALAALAWWYG